MADYNDLFTRYGTTVDYAEIDIRAYLRKPDCLNTADRIIQYDRSAAELIARCQGMIELMKQYRQDLTARYGQLATMNCKKQIKLERQNYGNIKYFISELTIYEDGTTESKHIATYPGKERTAAIKHFETLCKDHPNYEAIKDIARKAWER